MIFSWNYRYFRLPWVIRMLIFKKENRKSRDKNDFKTRCTEWYNFIKYKKCTPTFQAIGYKRMTQRCNPPNLPFRANGHTKVKLQFSSWPQITRWSVHKYIHNVTKVMCALYIRCALSVGKYGNIKLLSWVVQPFQHVSTKTGKGYVQLCLLPCIICFRVPFIKEIHQQNSKYIQNIKVTYYLWATTLSSPSVNEGKIGFNFIKINAWWQLS